MTDREFFSDEIDLRAFLRSLWGYKWFILGLTLAAVLAAFLVSKYSLPKEYKTAALITVAESGIETTLDSRIQISSQLPEPVLLTEIALADEVLLTTYQSSAVEALLDGDFTYNKFKSGLFPSVLGLDSKGQAEGAFQVRLEVVDTDPVSAAVIANAWAQAFTNYLNENYGTGSASLVQMETQVAIARENWDTTEQALLAYLPNSQVETLDLQLKDTRSQLKTIYEQRSLHESLIADMQFLIEALEPLPAQDPLPYHHALALAVIELRAVSGDIDQLPVVTFPIESINLTTGEAIGSLDQLISGQENLLAGLETKAAELEAVLPQLDTALEQAQYDESILTAQRDLAQDAYNALASQLEEMRISFQQQDQIARLSGQALQPTEPFSPRVTVNTALAGAVVFAIALGLAMVIHWWRSPAAISEGSAQEN